MLFERLEHKCLTHLYGFFMRPPPARHRLYTQSLTTYTREGHRAGRALRDWRPCMECGVEQIEVASGAPPRAFAEVDGSFQGTRTQYSPGDFLKQFGAVIAICLGLALLAHVLVAFTGVY